MYYCLIHKWYSKDQSCPECKIYSVTSGNTSIDLIINPQEQSIIPKEPATPVNVTAMQILYFEFDKNNTVSEMFEWLVCNRAKLLDLERKQIVDAVEAGADTSITGTRYFKEIFKQ